jgi:L,D-transpeptidase YcbB
MLRLPRKRRMEASRFGHENRKIWAREHTCHLGWPFPCYCSSVIVTSKYLGRLMLSMITLAVADSLVAQITDGSTSDEYRRTLNALEQYRALASEDDSEILPATKKPLEQGDHYAGVSRLIRLLTLVGDIPAADVPAVSDVYDATLVAAVKRFQTRHGLEPDGRLGKGTLAQLNTPLSFRVRQLELALERWRRVPYDPSRPAIVVNLPEFRLRAFDTGHQPALEMKIVIGRARKLQTPLLSSEIDTVIFRPYWNVPFSIQRKELVPDIIRDPSYISKNDFELVTPKGIVVAQDTVSDTLLAQLRSGTLHLRQRRGPKNSLGLVKFIFPNKYDVFMHDTPAKSLFARARRDFSHGCIRLESAQNLAEWVLREESGWRQDRIVAAMQGTESISVKLTSPIPVMTIYVTAVVAENGEVYFFEDLYGKDAAFERELAEALAGKNPG